MLRRVSEVLSVSREDLKRAILDDHEKTLDNYLDSGETLKDQTINSAQTEKPEQMKEVSTSATSFLGQPELKKGAY